MVIIFGFEVFEVEGVFRVVADTSKGSIDCGEPFATLEEATAFATAAVEHMKRLDITNGRLAKLLGEVKPS